MTTGRQAVAISALLMLANLFMAVFIFADTKLKARARSSRLRLSQLLAKGSQNDHQGANGPSDGVGDFEMMSVQINPMAVHTTPKDPGVDAEIEVVDDHQEEKAASQVQAPWVEATADDGRVYYHNTDTDETSWDLPRARSEHGGQ